MDVAAGAAVAHDAAVGGRMAMRKVALVGLLALAATAADTSGPAAAAPGAWCLRYEIGAEVVQERCHFPNFEACRREMYFWGSTAFCSQNPAYFWNAAPYGEPRYRKSKRKPAKYY
jgi:hypothetical protein